MKSARVIIARSGYSTLMDLAALGKRAILIPTPGQTEQEYLARRLKESGIAYSVGQDQFDLRVALQASEKYIGFTNISRHGRLEGVVEDWL
jgi:UDP-N-acetylglucosamine:LPS N-acetylglucosamine transferase